METPEEPPMAPERFLGVDLGIVNLAMDSDGHSATGAEVERVRQRCMTHRQTYQATGTKAAKRRLKKLAQQESRFRRWVNHRISKQSVAMLINGIVAAKPSSPVSGVDRRSMPISTRPEYWPLGGL
jgi:hypothetical protein